MTQEVFVRVHERLDSFRGEARFSTWLYRIAYNRTIERRRRARLRAEHVPCGDHTGSAAGAIDAIFTLAMLRGGWIAPCVNAEPLDPELLDYPPIVRPESRPLRTALSKLVVFDPSLPFSDVFTTRAGGDFNTLAVAWVRGEMFAPLWPSVRFGWTKRLPKC